jgi:D-arabinose 1-dehydrogenase-like Zn-dependent alcohol dehydrogenase
VKAAVVRSTGGPEALVIEGIAEPVAGPRDVIVRVAACGVCFHDVVTRNGALKAGVRLPFVPGHEVAGTVAAVGSAVKGFRPGDRVASTQRYHVCGHCRYCTSEREPLCDEAIFLGDAGLNGGYAEHVAIEEDNLAIVPKTVPLDDAAIAACAIGTMLHAIRAVGQVQKDETVLITGSGGGLGLHGIQLARLAGAHVIAQTTSPDKVPALEKLGASDIIVTARGDDFSAQVKQVAPAGADVVIDTVGTPVFASVRRSLAKGGRWVLVGQLTGDFIPFNPAQLFLRGVSMLSATSTTRQELIDVLGLMARGEVRAQIGERFPLDSVADAHRLIESGRALGRVVVKPH